MERLKDFLKRLVAALLAASPIPPLESILIAHVNHPIGLIVYFGLPLGAGFAVGRFFEKPTGFLMALGGCLACTAYGSIGAQKIGFSDSDLGQFLPSLLLGVSLMPAAAIGGWFGRRQRAGK